MTPSAADGHPCRGYALHDGGLVAVNPEGRVGFSLVVAGAGAMALVSEGLLVVATDEAVLWVG